MDGIITLKEHRRAGNIIISSPGGHRGKLAHTTAER